MIETPSTTKKGNTSGKNYFPVGHEHLNFFSTFFLCFLQAFKAFAVQTGNSGAGACAATVGVEETSFFTGSAAIKEKLKPKTNNNAINFFTNSP